MPRNGSGVYSVYTPGNPVVSLTTIDPAAFNNTTTDLATAMTNSVARNGEGVPTANWPMGNFKLTGLLAGSATGDSVAFGQSATFNVGTFGAGSATAPTVTNATGNTGAYWPTTTTWGIATNGVNAVTVDASQNVGIGVAPTGSFKLQTKGGNTQVESATFVPNLTFLKTGTTGWTVGGDGSGGVSSFLIALNGTNELALDSSGNVAPGTNNAQTNGLTGTRWANVYSVLGNYSGLLTASAGISTTTVTASGAGSFAGVAVGGALTTATTGNFSGLLTASAGVSVTGGTTTDTLAISLGAITSGTYTPTLTANTNVTTLSTNGTWKYSRVGSVVTVSGSMNVTCTAASGAFSFGFSLPVASNVSAINDCVGTSVNWSNTPMSCAVTADTTNHRGNLNGISNSTVAQVIQMSAQYLID